MSPSAFFESLGAPLVNVRWSWGALRHGDSAVFLRVWQDQCKRLNGQLLVRVGYVRNGEPNGDNLGRRERHEHLALIREGAQAYLVMCKAEDPSAAPRTVESFNSADVFVAGSLIEAEGSWWLEIIDRKPAAQIHA